MCLTSPASAARIEQLLKDQDYWVDDSAAAWDKCEARRLEVVAAEAKLAKAVEALEEIASYDTGMFAGIAVIARTVLVELETGK